MAKVATINIEGPVVVLPLEDDGNPLGPLWSQGQEIFQWQRTSSYRQTSYSH